MMKFICGVIFGIIISSTGFSGIVKLIDVGVNKIKQVTVEQIKS
jgi:hypothetical protein